MKLYFATGTIALAPLILLHEAGADFTAERLDFSRDEQRGEAYLRVNPRGRVPALVTAHGVLTEAPAIMAYIAETHPDAGLAAPTPFARAQVAEFISWLSSTVHVSHAHRVRGYRWSDDPAVIEGLKHKVAANMAAHFTEIEGLIRGPWVMGAQYTAADPYLYTVGRWLAPDGVDPAGFPNHAAHAARMEERPAVRQALQTHG